MKTKLLFIATSAAVLAFSCKKETEPQQHQHDYANYRVYFISKSLKDTTYTPTKGARVETVGIDSAYDARLKATLLAYDGHGGYTVQVTNLQPCQVKVKWGWEGLTIDSISPGGNQSIMEANQTITFKLTGSAKVGKIKLQAQGDCGNSSTLIINITTAILPIVYLNYTVSYNDKINKHVISFSVEQPQDINWIAIEQLVGSEYGLLYGIPGDDQTTNYNIKLP